jgi:hypothetical protein
MSPRIEEKITLKDSANELPPPGDDLEDESASTELVEVGGFVDVDTYHAGINNRSHLRRKIFLKWDTGNGFFKVGDDIVACGPKPPLVATVLGANFPWQLWSEMQLLCENKDPGKKPQQGDWNEKGIVSKKDCQSCPYNSKNGAKGQKVCKDSMQLNMSILLEGKERTVSMQTSNFKLIADFDDFLYKLEAMHRRVGEVTIKISRGEGIDVRGKKMFGWNIEKLADKPLWDYASDLFEANAKKL